MASFDDNTLAMLTFKYQNIFPTLTTIKLRELFHTHIISLQIQSLKQKSEEILGRIRQNELSEDQSLIRQLQQEHLVLRKKIDELSLSISQ